MQRMKCPGCGREFRVNAGCSCCVTTPAVYKCPECGAELIPDGPAYFFSGSYDDE